MTAWILHVDLDQFQAAVERLRNPELVGKPVIVGGSGDPTQSRVVVTCASYEAREHGVRAGMPLRSAVRRCPDAAFLPVDLDAYEGASEQVMDALRQFGPVEVLGWDEAFVGIDTDDPEDVAQRIRVRVYEETGLRCSVGVGDNTHRAKLATGFVKPKGTGAPALSGVFRLTAQNWAEVMADRGPDALWGVGARTAKRLADLGITTVGQLGAADRNELAAAFGPRTGPYLRLLGTGAGRIEVATEPRVARGRSHSRTFPQDLTDIADIRAGVVELATAVAHEVIASGRTIERVAVTVRTKTFFTSSHAHKLPAPSTDVDEVVTVALTLLGMFPLDRPVRLLGVRLDLTDLDQPPEMPSND
ncbi:DNA polymerase IV [Aldersonia kunmingensis]|uniref:DNA polymerase IV n=1 Tax=Aldersonia kunmingensis TaxID=408066 RepID=UPI0008379668|nr:DNA polymerase IV [Aldersonia kunmingensis]